MVIILYNKNKRYETAKNGICYNGDSHLFRRKFMKKKIMFPVLLTALLFAFGCSKGVEYGGGLANSMATQYEPSRATLMLDLADGSINEMQILPSEIESSSAANLYEVERKLVKRAEVRMRVENLETAEVSISGLLKKYDAYAASTSITENSHYYSLRVPSQVYDLFLAEISVTGRLIHRSENTEDVTVRYYDLEGRLETKKELLRTYQSYLGRARTIDEILSVEARIAELQYDIDGTGRQLRDLANRVDYATIELTLLGPAAASNQNSTFGERIKLMFGGFGGFLSSVGVVIIGIVIYVIPILLLLLFFFWLFFGKIGLVKKLWRIVKGKKQEI